MFAKIMLAKTLLECLIASVQRAKMRTYQDKKQLSDIAFFGILTIALVCIAMIGYGVIDWILRLLRI